MVTRYDDIKTIFRDHETYTAANTITPIVPFSEAVRQMLADGNYSPEPVLSNNVPPSHTRIRKLVNRLFTPRRMKSFAPAIRDIAERAIARIEAMKEADIVAETDLRISGICVISRPGCSRCRCASSESLGGQSHKTLLRQALGRRTDRDDPQSGAVLALCGRIWWRTKRVRRKTI